MKAFEGHYDAKNGILKVDIYKTFNPESTRQFLSYLNSDENADKRNRTLLKLHEDAQPLPDRETRKVMRKEGLLAGWGKIAIVGAKPGLQMFGKILMTALGKIKETQFFDDEEVAISWFREIELEGKKEKRSKGGTSE